MISFTEFHIFLIFIIEFTVPEMSTTKYNFFKFGIKLSPDLKKSFFSEHISVEVNPIESLI